MKILFVTGLTHYGLGGVQRMTVRLLEGMIEREVEVGLVVDCQIQSLEHVTYFLIAYPPPATVGEDIRQAIATFKPDIVHVLGGGIRLLQAIDRLALDVPWIVTLANVPPYERIFPLLLGRNRFHYLMRNLATTPNVLLWRRFLQQASFARAICHSPLVAKRLVEGGCPPSKVTEIALGSDILNLTAEGLEVSSPFPANAYPRILSVGGLVHHKGFHDYLHVVRRLVGEWPHLCYYIMGEGRDRRYRDYLKNLVEAMGLTNHVSILIGVSEEERIAALLNADLYVQPSHEEGFCLSYLEAAMLSRRLIGTKTGAIPLISGEDLAMRVVEPGDKLALDTATRSLLALEVSSDALMKRRGAIASRFSWSQHVEKLLVLYSELLPLMAGSFQD